MIQNNSKLQNYKVTVVCYTYNQSSYITDALNGFIMQETTFPFVCTIVDDASTDGEQRVIMDYMDKHFNLDDDSVSYRKETDFASIIYARHKNNKNCYFAVLLLKYNHYSLQKSKIEYVKEWNKNVAYMALCEGDDYWTDPYKLQKQVDYMESHLNCSLLHTSYMFYDQDNHTLKDPIIDNEIYREAFLKKKNIACEIIDFKYRVVTATSLFKSKMYDQLLNDPEYTKHKFLLGDIQLWAMLLQYGDIGYIPDNTAVYRVNSNSVCRSTNIKTGAKFSLSVAEMQMYFIPKVKGGEYLQEKFKNNFKKALFKYRLFDPQYKSFIKVEESELPLSYRVILSNVFTRSMVLLVWRLKRKVLRNSPTKISSMK